MKKKTQLEHFIKGVASIFDIFGSYPDYKKYYRTSLKEGQTIDQKRIASYWKNTGNYMRKAIKDYEQEIKQELDKKKREG